MQKYLFRAAVLILILSSLSCDRKAVPTNIVNQGCSTNADCAAQPGMICDLLVVPPGGKPGTCRQSCDPNATNCPNSQICNPVSGACEQSCAGLPNPASFCKGSLPSSNTSTAACICNNGTLTAGAGGGQPICSGSAYCALTTSNSNCPNGLKPSNGSCKFACQLGSDCVGPNQVCDSITKTCEVKCISSEATGSAKCTVLNYQAVVSSAVVPYTFSCSPITSTCVQSCNLNLPTTGAVPILSINRTFCYAPGGIPLGTGVGTYEVPCKGSKSCPDLGFQCAEGACQQACSEDKDCKVNKGKSGRTTCDVISGVCRTGCPASSCSTQGMACSPITSTCVPECTATATTCTTTGDIRSKCYTPGTATTGSCEMPCKAGCPTTSHTKFPAGFQCAEDICQQMCTALASSPDDDNNGCSKNDSGRTTCDLVSSVCRVGCSSKNGCKGAGLACSPISGTCVDICTAAAGCAADPTKSRTNCATNAVLTTPSTCEISCTAQDSACPAPAANLTCYYTSSILTALGKFCMIPCSLTSDCPEGLSCPPAGGVCS